MTLKRVAVSSRTERHFPMIQSINLCYRISDWEGDKNIGRGHSGTLMARVDRESIILLMHRLGQPHLGPNRRCGHWDAMNWTQTVARSRSTKGMHFPVICGYPVQPALRFISHDHTTHGGEESKNTPMVLFRIMFQIHEFPKVI